MRALHIVRRSVSLAAGALLSIFGVREVMFLAGAGMVGWGLAMVWLPSAFICPGLMLAYVSVFGVK